MNVFASTRENIAAEGETGGRKSLLGVNKEVTSTAPPGQQQETEPAETAPVPPVETVPVPPAETALEPVEGEEAQQVDGLDVAMSVSMGDVYTEDVKL